MGFSGFNFPSTNPLKERSCFFLVLATVRLQLKTTVTHRADGPGCGESDSGRGVVAHVLRALGAMAMTNARDAGVGS